MRIKTSETKNAEASADWSLRRRRAPEKMAALLKGLSQSCSRASPVVGHAAAGCGGVMCPRPWVHGIDVIITRARLTDSSHVTPGDGCRAPEGAQGAPHLRAIRLGA